MPDKIIIETIGILASILVIIGFLFREEKTIRLLNAGGCFIYIIYGLLIHSISVTVLNLVCLTIQVVTLFRMKQDEETKIN